ncbi:putative J domain-containing protein-like isoform X1 [Iris pallida]|uniref:J domain-containing protein-like isoform X1 n=1 Tax=Iris pallida TaxID=29817 RepID=A0AAX6HCS9_IRIPA|nr:putative J domain-containing protein-like isoform X1 [Iris pallida]
MRDDLRRRYDLSNDRKKEGFESNFSGLGSSSWNGPVGPHALFVDENKCIGCRECVHYASKTFTMDDALGTARVRVQFGDDEKSIEVAMESCPTDCIHWVESGELPLLEFLARPRPKEAHGIFGGGWERPRDVFAAAKLYQKQLKQRREQQSHGHGNRNGAVDEAEAETPAQAEARRDAGLKLRMGGILLVWSRFREMFGFGNNSGE